MPKKANYIPTRRRQSRWLLVSVAFLGLLVSLGVMVSIFNEHLHRPVVTDDTSVIIPAGAGRVVISAHLNRAGVLHLEWIMRLEELRRGKGYVPKAGEYNLPSGTSLSEAMSILHEGKVVQHSLTIPEGQTTRQVIAQLNSDKRLSGRIDSLPKEGTLLPETYFFERGTNREDLILWMQESQESVSRSLWSNRAADLPLETLEEAIILASIIEKETAKSSERKLVASVFINRLNRGMKLQADPTTLYGLWQSGEDVERLLKQHLSHDSPWNTYKYKGLPPTPIANPGLLSLAAALNPAKSDYLYFVADGKDGHNFAKTLAEHNENVRKWRKIQREGE